METKAPSRLALFVAIAFALSCVVLIIFVWQSFGGSLPLQAKEYRLRVALPAGSNLLAGGDVRISGVNVGHIVSADVRRGVTDATVAIEDRYQPLPADTRALVRNKTLLGESYLELSPGDPDGPKLSDGATIPVGHALAQQHLDDILNAFDKPTRRAFSRFVGEFARALHGRGGDINAALGEADPALTRLTNVVALLDAQAPAVRTLVSDGGAVLRAVGARRADLHRLISSGDAVFATTARRDRALEATVRALPPFLSGLRAFLHSARTTALDAAPALHALRPVAPLIRPALSETAALSPKLTALFTELDPVLDGAHRGLPPASDLLRRVRSLVDTIPATGRQLVPVADLLAAYRKEVVNLLASVGAASQASAAEPDGSRLHYLRVVPTIFSEGLLGLDHRLPSNRHNPYFEPGGLAGIGKTGPAGLHALSCANLQNQQTLPVIGLSGTLPCLVQQPWEFRGVKRSYPHVTALPEHR
jgi:virulence factor Mce-like protein